LLGCTPIAQPNKGGKDAYVVRWQTLAAFPVADQTRYWFWIEPKQEYPRGWPVDLGFIALCHAA